MKVKANEVQDPKFESVDINLSSRELEELYCIVNYTPVYDSCDTARALHQRLSAIMIEYNLAYRVHFADIAAIIKKHAAERR